MTAKQIVGWATGLAGFFTLFMFAALTLGDVLKAKPTTDSFSDPTEVRCLIDGRYRDVSKRELTTVDQGKVLCLTSYKW